MSEGGRIRERGLRFDEVAEAYAAHRPAYPDELVDAACSAAGVAAGDRVLEIGCGTGQLTTALVARGLQVVAVEPGEHMIEQARSRTGDAASFIHARFEDAALGAQRFAAVFSATAFHWVDPRVGWSKAASLLEPDGALVLLTHCSGADAESIAVERALFDSLAAIAPDLAAGRPHPRAAGELLGGAERRRANASELWSWISGHDELAVAEAGPLYADAEVLSRVVAFDWSAERLNAYRRTTSLAFRLTPEQLAAIEADTERIFADAGAGDGGRLRFPTLAVAAVAAVAPRGTGAVTR